MKEAVSPEMRDVICNKLKDIEIAENVKILFAAESGSRAWGFHSNDSDYDVRFVYARPLDWHLSLDKKRDVIEYPISDELDISGWELSKTLKLAANSNAVIAEWLQSPIIYQEMDGIRDELMKYCSNVLTSKSVVWHYVNLTKRQQERLIQPDGMIKLKRYFYCLRPAFALRWIRLHENPAPPMNIEDLMGAVDLPAPVIQYIRDLITVKRTAGEMGAADKSDPDCDALIERELEIAQEWLGNTAAETSQWLDEANAIHKKYSLM